jgi:hypothetical protein
MVANAAADLAYLRAGWGVSVEDDMLRRDTAVLRRLLVDGVFQQAWKAAGLPREPHIRCMSVDPVAFRVPPRQLVYASAGGGIYQGVQLGGALIIGDMAKEEVDALRTVGRIELELGLRKFMDNPCILAVGQAVSRRVLIKYVANKLGGVHFDPSRKQTREELLFSLLDWVAQSFEMIGKTGVYFELLSIGQAVARADAVERFLIQVTGKCPPLPYPPPPPLDG